MRVLFATIGNDSRSALMSEDFEWKTKGENERTELFAHLPHTYSGLRQLGSQSPSTLFFVIEISPIQAQLMRPFLFCGSLLQTLRPEPVCQGGAVVEMRMDKTGRSRGLFHARWEM